MSTRAQVFFPSLNVYLYQHSDGYGLYDIVRNAIAKGWRLDDDEYLARIVFCEMVKDDINGSMGFGIGSSKHSDIEYLVTVDVRRQEISEYKIFAEKTIRRENFMDIIQKK